MLSFRMILIGLIAAGTVGCGTQSAVTQPAAPSFQTKYFPIGLNVNSLKGSNQSYTGAKVYDNYGQANAVAQSNNNASATKQHGLLNIAPTVQPNVNTATPANVGNFSFPSLLW